MLGNKKESCIETKTFVISTKGRNLESKIRFKAREGRKKCKEAKCE